MRKAIFIICSFALSLTANAVDPTATHYSYIECQGSAMPYPVPAQTQRAIPDSLTPVFVNHIGRHGSRFLSSDKYTTTLTNYLNRADSLHTITPTGRELQKLCSVIVLNTAGRWGALDSLGMAEQRGIASRMHMLVPSLFNDTKVNAISSYSPRCIASMNEFTHQLTRLNNHVEIYSASGRQNSPLLRPWMHDKDYNEFIDSKQWHEEYDRYADATMPTTVASRILGDKYPFTPDEIHEVTQTAYKVIAGCSSMAIPVDASEYMTLDEYNALWSIDNLHHYLTHSASTISQAPMDMASALLADIMETMDQAANGANEYSVMLRFGHAETMAPLLALMRLSECYYMTNYFDTVGLHWRNFHVVPMASNLQMFLLKSKSGKLYVRIDLNEIPVPMIPGRDTIYTPWEKAKDYMIRCLPLHLQP